jgi:uncharacterized membrane protein YgcG
MKEVRTHPTVVVVGEVRSFTQQSASHVGQLFAGGWLLHFHSGYVWRVVGLSAALGVRWYTRHLLSNSAAILLTLCSLCGNRIDWVWQDYTVTTVPLRRRFLQGWKNGGVFSAETGGGGHSGEAGGGGGRV